MNFKMMQEVETCDANKREEKKVTERVDTEKTNTTKERETKKKEKSRFDQLEELFTDTQLRVDFDDCSWLVVLPVEQMVKVNSMEWRVSMKIHNQQYR